MSVPTPDLATDWKNASDDSPASITVTSVSQGELAAGLRIGDVTYAVNGSENGRNKYSDVLNPEFIVRWNSDGLQWQNDDGVINSGNVALPWQGSPEVEVLRDDIASEQNWEAV